MPTMRRQRWQQREARPSRSRKPAQDRPSGAGRCQQGGDQEGNRARLERQGRESQRDERRRQDPAARADGGQEAGLEEGDRDAEARRKAGDLRGRLMGVKTFRPTSPGRRQMTVLTTDELSPVKPEKRLLEYIKGSGGRNNQGRLSVRHHGALDVLQQA